MSKLPALLVSAVILAEGSCTRNATRFRDAQTDINRRTIARDDGVESARDEAIALWRAGDHRQASQVARRLFDEAPSDADNAVLLARILLDANQSVEAEEVLQHAVRQNPHCGTCYLLLGYAALDKEQPQRSEEYFRRARVLCADPLQRASAHLGLAALLDDLGRYEEADVEYALAIDVVPELKKALQDIETERAWPQAVASHGLHGGSRVSAAERRRRMEKILRDLQARGNEQ